MWERSWPSKRESQGVCLRWALTVRKCWETAAGQIDTRTLGSFWTAAGLIWENHTAQLTYGPRGPDSQMRELTTIKWGPSLRGSTGWRPVETSLSTSWGQVVSLFPEVPAVMFPARKFACRSICLFFQSIRSGMWHHVNVQLMLAVCVTWFCLFSHFGRLLFHNYYHLPFEEPECNLSPVSDRHTPRRRPLCF